MRYLIDNNKVFVALDRGEEIFSSLEKLALQENWQAAHVFAIGAVDKVELGVYDPASKGYYLRQSFPTIAELVSLDGNLSYKDGKPFFHLHGVLCGKDYNCFGGHLFTATVAAVCEVNLHILKGNVVREFNENIGIAHCMIR